jgi:hypothetical protein
LSKILHSKVDGHLFNYPLSDNSGYVSQNNLSTTSTLKFWLKIALGFMAANRKLRTTLKIRECYYGPFKGEFGHFLAHNLPFLMFLHSKGVKINYCGIQIHEPFMVDETGKSIVSSFVKLRDFYSEVIAKGNSTVLPKDVETVVQGFCKEATASGLPFWNIGDEYYYWFIQRNWLSKKNTSVYNLNKAYKIEKENACVIVPRTKSSTANHNNGEPWNYDEVVEIALLSFDKVYLCGHPSQVADLTIKNSRVVSAVSTDNNEIIKRVAASKVLITQHSGVLYLGEYTNTDVVLIYKGGEKPSDIGSLNNTLHYKKQFNGNSQLRFAFTLQQLKSDLNKHYYQN